MSRRVEVTRFVVGVACLTTVLVLLWLLLWITVVPLALGWTPVAIVSGSMSPGIATGDVVVAAPADAGSVGRGSVIVFDNPAGEGRVTHRVVDVGPSGGYITRGDANARIDSTPVPRHAVNGVGRILVPAIGAPVAWANTGEWLRLLLGLIVVTAAAWTSRWAVLARFDPFAHAGVSLEHAAVGWQRAVSSLRVPDPPTLTLRSGPQLVAGAAAVGLVASLAAGGVLQADGAFASTASSGGNALGTDTLDPPTGLTATGGTTVDLDWTATTDTYASGHRVYRATTSGGPFAQIAQITPRATVTYTDSPADGTYYYVVRAFFGPWESADSAEVSATVTTAEDYDGIIPAVDNCPSTFNVDQFDTDGDGTGDACDAFPTLATSGTFTDGGQSLDSGQSYDTAIGDLDGDGDLDVAFANNAGPNTVWFNDGVGSLTNSGQTLGSSDSRGITVGDVDGDGDLDLAFANDNGDANTVWFNDGAGSFTNSGQTLGSSDSQAAVVGDLDGDGDLDLAFGNDAGPNTVWFNNGAGVFTDSGQTLDASSTRGLALGDLDGDGDLDLAYANNGVDPSTVWFNDGTGVFTNSGVTLDVRDTQDVGVGDLDADGDLDLAYANENGDPNTVWFNDGAGVFSDSGQTLGSGDSQGVAVGDLDGDGDLDVTYANESGDPNTVWFNDGAGVYSDSGQTLSSSQSNDVAAGDLDGDGDLDLVFANAIAANTAWFNS